MKKTYNSWGLYPKPKHKKIININWRSENLFPLKSGYSVLAYGKGRSYGDNCLNNNNALIDTNRLSKFIDFDKEKGILTCEAGLSFNEIIFFRYSS